MPDSVPLVRELLEHEAIAEHRDDLAAGVRLYFSPPVAAAVRKFVGLTPGELASMRVERLAELDKTYSLTLLTCLESMIRRDFDHRCQTGKRARPPRASLPATPQGHG